MRRLLITNLSHMRRSDCNLPLSTKTLISVFLELSTLILIISFSASQNGAMHRYVGPFNKLSGVSGISLTTKYLLAYFTGRHLNKTACTSSVSCINVKIRTDPSKIHSPYILG